LLEKAAKVMGDYTDIEFIEAGASRPRILFDILLPQVLPTIGVALVLSTVTMMSVMSVPLMICVGTPTMLTVDMSFRVNSYGDYAVAN
ncbi:hypothetical protein Q6243_27435, partial [Klebsiella pneumoniae]|nr:hypothetical protein [Klebsiella pneumoniae]